MKAEQNNGVGTGYYFTPSLAERLLIAFGGDVRLQLRDGTVLPPGDGPSVFADPSEVQKTALVITVVLLFLYGVYRLARWAL